MVAVEALAVGEDLIMRMEREAVPVRNKKEARYFGNELLFLGLFRKGERA